MIFKLGVAPLNSFFTWPFLLFLLGAFLVFSGFLTSNGGFALWGGIFAGLGLAIWGSRTIEGWPTHWSLIVGLIGIAFLLQFAINKHHLSAVTGSVLVLIGFFWWPGIRELPFIAPVAGILHTIWPVFVVVLGIFLMLRK
ncbi:hypothetical protein [Lihuaxuella thermophila]|nr:hypothetical protein [Lihuaxuella thermophila]